MPQREAPRSNPHMSLSNEVLKDKLPDHMKIEQRSDGSVWIIEELTKPTNKDGKQVGPDRSERRIDSRQDRDMIAKGEEPWYMKHIRASKKESSK